MRVVAHDPFISTEIADGLGVELLSLDELCAAADYLTLHLPSTPETKHLFNDARFARCKPGIRIINTARGELIDEAALRRAIDSGHRRRRRRSTCSKRSRRPIGRSPNCRR